MNQFAKELVVSGDQQMNTAVTLLLEDHPNPKAIESARMATEMFLKAFLAARGGLTDSSAKTIGHNLEIALDGCLAVDDKSELRVVRKDLHLLPTINDRYKGTDKSPKELWHGYAIAQFTATSVVRSLTRRDTRKTI